MLQTPVLVFKLLETTHRCYRDTMQVSVYWPAHLLASGNSEERNYALGRGAANVRCAFPCAEFFQGAAIGRTIAAGIFRIK